MQQGRRGLADHLVGAVAEHPLGTEIEAADDAIAVEGDDRHLGRRLQHAAEQYVQPTQFGGTLGDLVLQAGIELADAGLGGLLRGDVAYGLRGADHAAVRTEDRRDGHRHVEQVAILVPAHGIEADHLFFTGDAGEDVEFLVLLGWRHQQVHHPPPDRLLLAVAEQRLGPAIPVADDAVEADADDAVRRIADDRRQPRLGRRLPTPAQAAEGAGVDQRRQQQADQAAGQEQDARRRLVQALDEQRQCAERHLPVPTVDLPPQHVAEQALSRRCGAVDEEGHGSAVAGDVAEFEVDRRVVDGQPGQHLAGQQRRIAPAEAFEFALGPRRWSDAAAVDRHQDEERLLAQAAGLDQGDRPRQAHLPGLQGGAGGLPAIGFRGDVQAQRLAVARHRLDVLDDVALAIVRSQLLDAELRLAVGPRLAQEPGLVGGRHPAYEAEAAGAGKLAVDVAGQAVAAEQFAVDVHLARRQQGTAHPAQAILVEFHAAGHRLGQQFRLAFQRHPRLLLVDQRQPPGAQPGQQQSERQCRARPAAQPELALLYVHPIFRPCAGPARGNPALPAPFRPRRLDQAGGFLRRIIRPQV